MDASTLLIVGAGMSVNLGLPTTTKINKILKTLLDVEHANSPRPISVRLDDVASDNITLDDIARTDFEATLSILFDGNGALNNQDANDFQDKAIDEYVKNFSKIIPGTKCGALKHHLYSLSRNYDLLALKSIIYSLGLQSPDINVLDILTAIQCSINDGISIPTREIFPQEVDETQIIYYCDRTRLEGALNAYKLLIYKIIKHILRQLNAGQIERYEEFYYQMARKYCELEKLDNIADSWKKKNYLSTFGYLTYNWDPVLPFLSMKANHKVNGELLKNCGDGPCKKVYADFGVPFAGIKLSGEHLDSPVYSFAEDAAFIINAFTKDCYAKDSKYEDKKSKLLIKIIKQFVPHGLFNMRICPRCQNGLFVFPEDMGKFQFRDIANIFVTDPIPSLYDMSFVASQQFKKIETKYKVGLPDELDCPSCDHPVRFRHSFLEIQSIVKNEKPAAINKIQFDYADYFSRANHIVSIGYSFPKDDILNSVFLKNMKIRKDDIGRDCKLSFIDYDERYADRGWLNVDDLDSDIAKEFEPTINVITNVFGKKNIRMNFAGFPGILDKVHDLDEIMLWPRL